MSELRTNFSKPSRKFKPYARKKPCILCQQGANYVDYKDVDLLNRYLSYNGKILPRRITGCCAKHQRMIANAIKKSRIVALLPFVKE